MSSWVLASKDIEFNEEISGDDDTEPVKIKVFTNRKDLPASLIDLEQLQEANHWLPHESPQQHLNTSKS